MEHVKNFVGMLVIMAVMAFGMLGFFTFVLWEIPPIMVVRACIGLSLLVAAIFALGEWIKK